MRVVCRCTDTITLFQGANIALGVCQADPQAVQQQACGRLGQTCCTHTDQAGWEWRTCGDGQPGVFCGADNTCTGCPDTNTDAGMSQALLAALSLPGVGNTC